MSAEMVRIHVEASDRAPAISRHLFGKFTEHLGRNVYQGAWAQIVPNPEFAPTDRWPDRSLLLDRLVSVASLFQLPRLRAEAREGMAPYWARFGSAKAGHWALGTEDVQKLRFAGGTVRVETGVFLPLHRVRSYELTLKGRSKEPTTAKAFVRRVDGEVIARADFPLGPDFMTVKCPIEVGADAKVQLGQPLVLGIELVGPGEVDLARLLLFPSDHRDGWEPEVVHRLREADLPLLRFPGGNFVSGYHWQDGVGPLDSRPVLPNPAWSEIEWNHVGTDEWLNLCHLTGATPMICVNAGNGDSQEAKRWVEYCNGPAHEGMGRMRAANRHPEPYGVRYWEIGNELYGSWQIGNTDGEGYARRYADFSAAMQAADPRILIIANGQSRSFKGTRIVDLTEYWNEKLLEHNGGNVRSISVHSLVGGGLPQDAPDVDPLELWSELVAYADGYGEYLEGLVGAPMKRAGLEPKAAVTELQIFTNKSGLPNNRALSEALWLASILNSCIRRGALVEMITHSALMNHGGGLRKERAVVFTDPVWWTTHLYSSQPATIPAKVDVDSPFFSTTGKWVMKRNRVPYLDALALLTESGEECALFVVNRHPSEAMTGTIDITGFQPGPEADVETLTASSLLAINTWERPDQVAVKHGRLRLKGTQCRHTFPPISLTRIRLRK